MGPGSIVCKGYNSTILNYFLHCASHAREKTASVAKRDIAEEDQQRPGDDSYVS